MYNIHYLQSHDFATNEFVHCTFKCNAIFFDQITSAMLDIECFEGLAHLENNKAFNLKPYQRSLGK